MAHLQWGTCFKNLARASCVCTHGIQILESNQAKALQFHLRVHSSAHKNGSSWDFTHPLAGSTGKTHLKLNFYQTHLERTTVAHGKLKSLGDLDTQATQSDLRHTLGEWNRQ